MEQWSFNSHFYDKVNFGQTIHEKPLLLRHTNGKAKQGFKTIRTVRNTPKTAEKPAKTRKNQEKVDFY